MNECPKPQKKQGHHGSGQSFPQQVQAHFGLPLRLAAVAVVVAPLPEPVGVARRRVRVRGERFNSPNRGVAVHLRASRSSAASVALRRRSFFFFPPLVDRRIAARDKPHLQKEAEG